MEYYARRERERNHADSDIVDSQPKAQHHDHPRALHNYHSRVLHTKQQTSVHRNQPRALHHNSHRADDPHHHRAVDNYVRASDNKSHKTKAPDYSEHNRYPHHSEEHSSKHSNYQGSKDIKHTERLFIASKYKHEEIDSDDGTPLATDQTSETDVECEVETEPECTVMIWEQFLEDPRIMHEGLADYTNSGQYDERFLDLTGADTNKKILEFEVNTADAMEKLTRDLVGRLILFRGKVTHDRTWYTTEHWEGSFKFRRETHFWKDKLAILVNTGHDNIRETLQNQLDTAAKHLKEGEQFCLELSFGYGVRRWYSLKVDVQGYNDYPTTREDETSHMCIFIHNCSPPVRFFMSKVAIILCCPCWFCACGPCYYCHRKNKVTDMKERFHVTVTARRTKTERPRHIPFCRYYRLQMETQECTSLTLQERELDKIL